ncbi:unnamed protein product [Cyclocybe aegerita]|uniref:Uncharacterized protein n=1 Tax=Cyclocybe aegerita TaxID=1973307 RepID=A0A8S0VUV8_CYCAE|nr:unnamed protein product [Cyclocybe aegerita]
MSFTPLNAPSKMRIELESSSSSDSPRPADNGGAASWEFQGLTSSSVRRILPMHPYGNLNGAIRERRPRAPAKKALSPPLDDIDEEPPCPRGSKPNTAVRGWDLRHAARRPRWHPVRTGGEARRAASMP